jgi:hypothetical protein
MKTLSLYTPKILSEKIKWDSPIPNELQNKELQKRKTFRVTKGNGKQCGRKESNIRNQKQILISTTHENHFLAEKNLNDISIFLPELKRTPSISSCPVHFYLTPLETPNRKTPYKLELKKWRS